MFRKSAKAILSGGIIFILLWQLYENQKIEMHIPCSPGQDLVLVMPLRDKKRLECLFYKLFIRDAGAYTLFGSKPMFMGGYVEPFASSSWEDCVLSLFPCNLKTYTGWKTWKKYQHIFPMSQFVLWAEQNPFWQEPHSAMSLILIHKQKFQETVNSYLRDFQEVLHTENINAEELLLQAKGKLFLKEVLKNHNGLIGTLFGFGRENAWLFEARDHGKQVPLTYLWDQDVYEFLNDRKEIAWIYFGICSNNISEHLGYPTFVADPNSLETQMLKKKFLSTRAKILEYYQDKDLVEATLALLIDGSPEKAL